MAGDDFQKCPFFRVSGVFQSTGELTAVGSNPTVSAKKKPRGTRLSGFFFVLNCMAFCMVFLKYINK